MAEKVNLDALIPREDFLASEGFDKGVGNKTEASTTDLKKGESFFLTLRKPDFQRETSAWSPEAIRDIVIAFVEGDLIPAAIMWQSPSRLSFVIDGAHRLSAIIAWIMDDYGDGDESIKFYNNKIPDKQRDLASKTRLLIKKSIGSYKDIYAETQNPGSNPNLTNQARALAFSTIPLQWIKSSEAKKAENAFFVINQSAVQIDPTELKILNSRFEPSAISSRAIVKNGTGHKYWEKFSLEGQVEVERIAQESHEYLYTPPLKTRTVELPIAGHGYGSQTLPLIFDLVNIANRVPVVDSSKSKRSKNQGQETTPPNEEETISSLKESLRLIKRITSTDPSSLGLYPPVYFYSSSGKHQPTSVLAMASLLKEMNDTNSYIRFTKVRAKFEQFLIDNKMFINQLTVKNGSMAKGFRQIKEFYEFVLNLFQDDQDSDQIIKALSEDEKFRFLKKADVILTTKAKPMSQSASQFAYLRDTMDKALICSLCLARIDPKAMHLDHTIDKKDGGLGTADNGRWLHPFCNSTYKDFLSKNKNKV